MCTVPRVHVGRYVDGYVGTLLELVVSFGFQFTHAGFACAALESSSQLQ